ncbi:hypothetical protein GCT13_07270 [Paraburkholderia sp. CNPSo 3157]|uniref:Uncharacterized protein n=1 Tax=Paraburkholderia franconis TaxID=2654983 RepID=A0A7X1N823_9BURK|nr:hypothetical protein [Paraburkholderia franconis]MPW16741.1 hypothetical protein [Paraburkholderia franconis]
MSVSTIGPTYPVYKIDHDGQDQPTPDNSGRYGGDYLHPESKKTDNPGGDVQPTTPQKVPTPPKTPIGSSAREPLAGATSDELLHLSYVFDSTAQGRQGMPLGVSNDAGIADKLQKVCEMDMAGYPPDVQDFESRVWDSQALLAALSPTAREFYAGALATLDAVYRNATSADAKNLIKAKLLSLQDDIRNEYNNAINDPLERVLSVFNEPLGAGYLNADDKQRLAQLKEMRQKFLDAPDAASREKIFRDAVSLKSVLQQTAMIGIDKYVAEDKKKWEDANRYVSQIIEEAGQITDPLARYKSIGDKLFSLNAGMGEDDVADRRILAFTQRMRDDVDLRSMLDKWAVQAGIPLNEAGVGGAPNYTGILNDPPPAGPDYIRDLADRYTGVLKDTTKAELEASNRKVRPYLQVAEGFIRFVLGMTPLAPLTAVLDEASVLSPEARMGIEFASGILGFLDPAGFVETRIASFVSDVAREAEEDGNGGSTLVRLSTGTARTTGEGAVGGTTEEVAGTVQPRYLQVPEGPTYDPALLAAKARIKGESLPVPEGYRVQVDATSLKPDENAPGVYTDDQFRHYIKNGDQHYAVDYDAANDTWRVVHPDSPGRYAYPVKYDPASRTWMINPDVGLKGGSPLSRLVSLKRFMSDPRVAKLVQSKMLKPQNPHTCFLDHGSVAKHAADVPDGRLIPVSTGRLTAQQLRAELDKGPVVLSARNIARPDSNYSGMHTVVLLKTVKEDGREYVLGIDLDDTVTRNGQAQSLDEGDFGGVEYDINKLVDEAAPYVDEDTGNTLEMYHRPEQRSGLWSWWK